MPKERCVPSVASNRVRVSPYPLRSSRNNKQKAPESRIQTENAEQWESVQCVICLEPPHNVVLLQCSSKGCYPYMCDTSARHSNCFKQFRRNTSNHLNLKTLICPLCRGEVYDTVKVSRARRFMNAKARSCSIEDCDFSGTYTQLKIHLKADHPGLIPAKVDPWKQRVWEHMQRESEYIEIMNAAGIPHRPEILHPTPLIQVRLDGLIRSIYSPSGVRTGFGADDNYLATLTPRLEIRASTMFHG